MWELYKYLYFRLYRWNLEKWGQSDMPHFNAMFGVAFLAFLNFVTLIMLFEAAFKINVVDPSAIPKVIIVLLLTVWSFINYFFFIHKNKYVAIFNEFQKKEQGSKRELNIIFLVYLVGSFFSYFFIGWVISLQ